RSVTRYNLYIICDLFSFYAYSPPLDLHSFPTRRSSDLRRDLVLQFRRTRGRRRREGREVNHATSRQGCGESSRMPGHMRMPGHRSEEHTSELQSHLNLVCRLLLEKKKRKMIK